MNRKNLTAAVLAGLAGAAGLAGTAQAVNLNPDGLGQVLIYPYYTANGGNTTILSVVNTTESAKAVKVRFLEGFNSREVLDFNLYLSHHDVWVAAVANGAPAPDYDATDYDTDTMLIIPDDSCTVPYLYEDYQVELETGGLAGIQPFLDYAYTGKLNDGGPDSPQRAAEGYMTLIEMGTIVAGSDTEEWITHRKHDAVKDKDGNVTEPAYWGPGDCGELVDAWTGPKGTWYKEATAAGNDQASTDTERNSGGLFGGGAVINPGNGAMFSYDAKAVQGFDSTDDGIHFKPGTIHPDLDDGNEQTAWVFFGVPQNKAVDLFYPISVDAVSAVFMHEYTMNEFTTADSPAEAATEWVVNFPTKHYYVDRDFIDSEEETVWQPSTSLPGGKGVGIASCNYWTPGFSFPTSTAPGTDVPIDGPGPWPNPGWEECIYEGIAKNIDPTNARPPFTQFYNGGACEEVELQTWDRSERTYLDPSTPGDPPVVSPSPPPGKPDEPVAFELCNEVNVLRFGSRSIFDTPEIDGDSLLLTIDDEYTEGWAKINYYADTDHKDAAGLVGLPVTGFSAWQFENGYVENDEGDQVKAFYGGLFVHKGNVRKVSTRQLDK